MKELFFLAELGIRNTCSLLRATRVGMTVLYYLAKYTLFGGYDARMIELINAISRRGPIYVKVLQSLAGTSGFLSPEVQDFLTGFSDNVPYGCNDERYNYILERVSYVSGKHPELLVSNISDMPIHSGTISLVYGARIGDTPVVIKCNRQNIRVRMVKAIEEAEFIVSALELIPSIRALSLSRVLSENRMSLLDQTSMSQELENMTEIRTKMFDRDYIVVPKPYPEFTRTFDDILVMEKLSGKSVRDVSLDEAEEYGTLLAQQCVDSITNDSVYHADLHSGNILFISDGGTKKLGLLDFGIVGRLNESERLTLSSFYISLGMGNYDDVVNSLIGTVVNANALEAMGPVERGSVVQELVTLTEDACTSKEGFTPHHMRQINGIFTRNGLQLAPVFCRIEMALAMNMAVSQALETKDRNFLNYLQTVIQSKMDLSVYDV